MPVSEHLNVRMTADTKQAVAGMKQFSTELGRVPAQVNRTEQALNKTGVAVRKTGKDFTNFNRVIADAPYGLNGVANNLQQLFPAAGAVGLAITALTTALVFAQVGFGAWTRGLSSSAKATEEHGKKLREAKAALDMYLDGLNDIDQARIRGEQAAQDELVKLQTLYNATQNANIPLAKRRQLVDELQAQYPKYFANLSDEAILAGRGEKAYKGLSDAILASARARASQDSLVDIQKDVLVIEQKQVDIQSKLAAQLQRVNRARAAANKLGAFDPQGMAAVDSRSLSVQNDLNAQTEKYNALIAESTSYILERNRLLGRAENLTKNITAITENNPDALLKPGSSAKAAQKAGKDILKELQDALDGAKIPGINLGEVPLVPGEFDLRQGDAFFKRIQESLQKGIEDNQGIIFEPKIERALILSKFDEQFKSIGESLPKELKVGSVVQLIDQVTSLEHLKKGLQELYDKAKAPIDTLKIQINTAISSGLASGLAGIGEGIGQAIATGGSVIEAAGRSILGAVGDLITQIGKALIEYGIVKQGLDAILAAGIAIPGVAAIVAGTAAVAVGALVKAAAYKPKAFAEGGLVYGPTLGLVGEGSGTSRSNPEVIAPLDKLKNIIGGTSNQVEVVGEFELRGDKLVAVIAKTNQRHGRAYGR